MVGQLFAKGLIEMAGEYRSIVVTPQGRAFLNSNEPIEVKRQTERPLASVKRQPVEVPADFDEALLQRLKSKRLELAQAKGAPAYTIFSDRTLIDMAVRQPSDQSELLAVYGVGLRKAEVYGEIFLKVIASEG